MKPDSTLAAVTGTSTGNAAIRTDRISAGPIDTADQAAKLSGTTVGKLDSAPVLDVRFTLESDGTGQCTAIGVTDFHQAVARDDDGTFNVRITFNLH